ncbi:uncharacterized protein B4U80_14768 [Leptotrombidium deliense]|uniref:RING-type domain-containing protein n=1 Tax=Leptotrombidium deliense TaxID=299467 RepID=A0A443QHT4_9ACAR|nr:uncharacterized protein B4U80_14768 [Leptotrombidium deliense]
MNDANFMIKYDTLCLKRFLAKEPQCQWCPNPDCDFAVIADPSCIDCPEIKCETCNTTFDYKPHGVMNENLNYDFFSKLAKPCPVCKTPIIKADDGSCNQITCTNFAGCV